MPLRNFQSVLMMNIIYLGLIVRIVLVGGVAVYCKRLLNPVRIPLPEALREGEAVCIDVVQRYRIVSMYRPPNCSNIYHDNMYKLISFLALPKQ